MKPVDLVNREVHTQIEWVTKILEDTIVYVDENGVPYKTDVPNSAPTPAAINVQLTANTPAPVAAKPTEPAKVDVTQAMKYPQPEPIPAPVPSPVPVPAVVPSPAPAAAKPEPEVVAPPAPVQPEAQYPAEFQDKYATAAAGMVRSNGYGVSWTPFAGEENSVTCKPQDQADEEFAKMARMQFTSVRVYGVACKQVEIAMRAASENGMKVMLGVFDLANVAGETQDIIRQVQDTGLGWGMVETISIGNEDVNKGSASADAVIQAVGTARGILRGAGYQGPVVHVETHGAILANPQLCSEAAGDYIAANIHPFFNPLIVSYFAGKYVKSQVEALRECSAQQSRKRSEHRVVVTETGWPTSGWPNGLAIPSRGQQFAAIKSIKRELAGDVYLFSAFNNRWQRDSAGTFGAEKHWGLLMD